VSTFFRGLSPRAQGSPASSNEIPTAFAIIPARRLGVVSSAVGSSPLSQLPFFGESDETDDDERTAIG